MLTGQNGILTRAGDTKEAERGSEVKEAVRLAIMSNLVSNYANGNIQNKEDVVLDLKSKEKLNEEEVKILENEDEITIGGIYIDFSELNIQKGLKLKYIQNGKNIFIRVSYTASQLEKMIEEAAESALNSSTEMDEEERAYFERLKNFSNDKELQEEEKQNAQEQEIPYEEYLEGMLIYQMGMYLPDLQLKVKIDGEDLEENKIDGAMFTVSKSGTYDVEATTQDGKKGNISIKLNDIEKMVTIISGMGANERCICYFVPKDNQTWYNLACDNSIKEIDKNIIAGTRLRYFKKYYS